MLDFVRNKQKSVLIKLAFAIIILSFVIGYAMLTSPGDSGGPGGQPQVAATVNDKDIAYNDFQTAYSNLYQLYQNIYQQQFTPAMEKQLKLAGKSLDNLIDQALLLEEAERMNLEVSQKELVDSIAKVQAFQQDGQFSKDRYLQVLAYQRLTPEGFEELQRRDLLVEKVRAKLQEGVVVSEEDIEEEYRKQNDKINLDFVRFAPALFESKVKVTDEELAAFFEAEQETFRVPEKISLKYLQFDPERYVDDVAYDDESLEKYHRRHQDQFEIEEQIKASHILIKVDKDADDDVRTKKKAFAEELLADAKGGKDFSELARTYSDDSGSAAKGGELGYFKRGTMVPPFEQAAFNMNPGQISDLVETTFGYHIIKVEAYIEPGIKPLDEVLDQVKLGLQVAESKQLAYEKAMDAYNINRKSGDLDAAASANELGLKETGLFTRNDAIDGIGRNEEIIEAAFALEKGELGRPVQTDDGIILFAIKERIPSHIPELDEVKDLVEASYRRVKAKDLAKTAAEELLEKLRDGGSLSKLAKKAGQSVEETGPFAESYSPFVPRIGTSEELADAAFALADDATLIDQVYEIQGRYVIATLKAREAADMEKLDDAKKEELQEALLTRMQNEAVQEKVDALRAAATITVTPQVQAILDQENQP